MKEDLLIETKVIDNYRIKIYYDEDAQCPIQDCGMCGRYLFEYSDRYTNRLSYNCNWNDWFLDNNHSIDDALQYMANQLIEQEDIVKYYKSNNIERVLFAYNSGSRLWELKTQNRDGISWYVEHEFEPSELKTLDLKDDLLECLDRDELISLISDCAKDFVIKEWSSTGYCQGDYVYGIAYMSKKRYDKLCGLTDIDWKQGAIECIDKEVEAIGMWIWGDVKGFVLEKKVEDTKQFHDKTREDEDCFDWEEVDSCWGEYMQTEELINDVISEHGLEKSA